MYPFLQAFLTNNNMTDQCEHRVSRSRRKSTQSLHNGTKSSKSNLSKSRIQSCNGSPTKGKPNVRFTPDTKEDKTNLQLKIEMVQCRLLTTEEVLKAVKKSPVRITIKSKITENTPNTTKSIIVENGSKIIENGQTESKCKVKENGPNSSKCNISTKNQNGNKIEMTENYQNYKITKNTPDTTSKSIIKENGSNGPNKIKIIENGQTESNCKSTENDSNSPKCKITEENKNGNESKTTENYQYYKITKL